MDQKQADIIYFLSGDAEETSYLYNENCVFVRIIHAFQSSHMKVSVTSMYVSWLKSTYDNCACFFS
jgi:hypothetical protein